jgi:L,D-peptidoglycan transpeptidase YkuD (ErfK/YbiS/YcfS/YnhG family)
MKRRTAAQFTVRKIVTCIHVRAINARASRGVLVVGAMRIPCILGRAGRTHLKREGDGATPVGCWRLVALLYRADRVLRPRSGVAARAFKRSDGWCDAAGDRNYNRQVRLPYPSGHETLWRSDRLYDVIGVLSYNLRPRVRARGSAIFLHLAAKGGQATSGCIAVAVRDMRTVLAQCGPRTSFVVW